MKPALLYNVTIDNIGITTVYTYVEMYQSKSLQYVIPFD